MSTHCGSFWAPGFVAVGALARGVVNCLGVGVVEGGPLFRAEWLDVSTFVPANLVGNPTCFAEVVVGGPGAARFLPP